MLTKKITIPAEVVEYTFAQYIGERIRKRRKRLGMTITDVTELTEISRAYLCEVEQGKRSIGYAKLYSLAKTLGRSTDWFAKGWE